MTAAARLSPSLVPRWRCNAVALTGRRNPGLSRQLQRLPLPRPQRVCASPRRQRGYSLIEVIVAFALLALALTLLLGTLSGAARQVRWSGDAGRAALHAQSLLDQVGVGEAIKPGQRSGEFDAGRYRWNLAITRWTDPALPPAITIDPAAARLYEVSLTVRWGDGRAGEQLQLSTLRLAAADIEAVLP